jgi:hypothetical protein
MVKPKAPQELKRPRRRLGDVIRALVACPLCGPDLRPGGTGVEPMKVVAYRRNTIRLECPACGLRFSIATVDLFDALEHGRFRSAMAEVVWNRHEG